MIFLSELIAFANSRAITNSVINNNLHGLLYSIDLKF